MIDRFGRIWTVLLPAALLAAAFKYAYQLNSIINSIEGMSFKKNVTIMFISFLAVWSLLYLCSVFFVRVMKWIWNGTLPTQTEKPNVHGKKESENHLKNSTEHPTEEQESLFRLDLQDEPIDYSDAEKHKEDRVFK